jgi:probable HAF family extracellular repeat protein
MKRQYSRLKISLILAIFLTVFFGTGPVIAGGPSFQGLGFLGTAGNSYANGVSADGTVVVGTSNYEAFHWTEEDGMVGLGFLVGTENSAAHGVSADGNVVVGRSKWSQSNEIADYEAFRWTYDEGMVSLGFLPSEYPSSWANAISADGNVVVGGSNFWSYAAFSWTEEDGMLNLNPIPSYSIEADHIAYGVSADGSVVVGHWGLAFRWTEDDGMMYLPDMGWERSYATGVSADGSVIVGYGLHDEAFRWTEDGGMELLGTLPGGVESMAYGVSADGSMVVGECGWKACLWDKNNTIYSLYEVLVGLGLEDELNRWELHRATAISADGLTIVGFGTNPDGRWEAWRAELGGRVLTIKGLIKLIENKFIFGGIIKGQANALISKLKAAARLFEDGNIRPAGNLLKAFINQVEAMMKSGRMSEVDGQELITAATSIKKNL